MPSDVNLGVRSPKGLLPLCRSKIHLRFPIARDHVIILKFSLPFRIVTGHKLVAASYADGSGGPFSRPARLRRARSPVRTSPLASELPLTCEALPFAGGPSGPYLSACGGQLLIVRCAHYAGGASLTTFGFVTIVPRYLLPQVMPSHSFAARTRAYCAPHKRSWKPTNACQCQPPRDPEGRRARTRQRHLAALFFNIMTKKGRKVNCHRYQKHDI